MGWDKTLKAAFLTVAMAATGSAFAQNEAVDQAPVDNSATSLEEKNDELNKWKNDNPAGFKRALDNTTAAHLKILNAQRYDHNRPLLSEQDRENIVEKLPENPDLIQKRTGQIVQSLSPEAREWRDSMTDITNNLDLAGQLLLHKDEFEDVEVTGLLTASQAIAGKYDMTLSQAVEGLRLNASDDLREKINTMEQAAPLAEMESKPNRGISRPLTSLGQPKL